MKAKTKVRDIGGVTMAERRAIAERLGISHQAVSERIRRGWTVDRIAGQAARIVSHRDLLTVEDMDNAVVPTRCSCDSCKAGRAASKPRTLAERWARTVREWEGQRRHNNARVDVNETAGSMIGKANRSYGRVI